MFTWTVIATHFTRYIVQDSTWNTKTKIEKNKRTWLGIHKNSREKIKYGINGIWRSNKKKNAENEEIKSRKLFAMDMEDMSSTFYADLIKFWDFVIFP